MYARQNTSAYLQFKWCSFKHNINLCVLNESMNEWLQREQSVYADSCTAWQALSHLPSRVRSCWIYGTPQMESYEVFCQRSLALLQPEGPRTQKSWEPLWTLQTGSVIHFRGRAVLSPLVRRELIIIDIIRSYIPWVSDASHAFMTRASVFPKRERVCRHLTVCIPELHGNNVLSQADKERKCQDRLWPETHIYMQIDVIIFDQKTLCKWIQVVPVMVFLDCVGWVLFIRSACLRVRGQS